MIDFNSKIPGAPNFQYIEFIKSDTATRLGIKNIPNNQQLLAIERLAVNVIQPLRIEFGAIRITSGYRSLKLCLAVGSGSTSNHIKGEAADIEPVDTSVSLFEMLAYIHYNLPHRELIAEYFPNGWVHVAYREGDDSRILKLKDEKHNYQKVKFEYLEGIYGV
jgi:zinc D-Ala-D-Ala carboxypeptidase